jgi:branched-chain amino acid transport system ATP-binding protein
VPDGRRDRAARSQRRRQDHDAAHHHGSLAGEIGARSFADHDITTLGHPGHRPAGIGFVPEDMGIFSDLTVEENMTLAAASGPIDRPGSPGSSGCFRRSAHSGISSAGNLSGGQKQMLSIARAIIEERQLILIDEPTKGLAPAIISTMAGALARPQDRQGASILLVEQNFSVAQGTRRHGAVMDDGRIIWAGHGRTGRTMPPCRNG